MSNYDPRELCLWGMDIFFKTMYDKTIAVDWGFVIFRGNNQGLSKCYQGYGSADNTYLDLDYSGSYKLTQ